MKNVQITQEIERLLQFSLNHRLIEKLDVIQSRNALLDLLQISEPYGESISQETLESPVVILEKLLDYANEVGIIKDNTLTSRDLLDAKIMGLLMPRQSEVVRDFFSTYEKQGPKRATDDYYELSKASNYIRMDRIAKNLYWQAPTEYGDLEITVNLSKPEKDPKEIAASKLRPQSNYPKCLLCIENVGFAGHVNHPARQNHRVIPITLGKEQWDLQYSPYVYYNEHCIVFHEQHVPMKISEKTFIRLFDFVEQFPHYFVGSNADLPIVGGSILSHEHFQGGRHAFPMEKAVVESEFINESYQNVKAGIVKWPMSVIRLSSNDKVELIKLSMEVLENWKEYSDEATNIRAYSDEGLEKIPHNTITPIVRRNSSGEFEIDLVLRNNRTSSENPDGIFHPHKELHHIKKENIGLIEVMGLAVLPARLETELKEIEKILIGDLKIFEKTQEDTSHPLNKHLNWIKELINKYALVKANEIPEILRKEVGFKFLQVLLDSGVYKRDEAGVTGFNKFMNSIGFKNLKDNK
ncbi:MAG: UDP-glucose--hexose-1-phosphate uridylyltransferase [Clostridiaceae bacterium]|nr:UDP-glucose--hexose-1-phosphate uridylyltransferase [Clostridiaceae bacterium]